MTYKKPKINLIVYFIVALFLLTPDFAGARGLVPCGGYGEAPCNVYHVFYIAALLTNWLIAVAGIYAAYQILSAGFWLTTTMGNEEVIGKYKKMATNAVVGMVMVMIAYLVVNTAVNIILSSRCQVNLKSPLDYVKYPCEISGDKNQKQINPEYEKIQKDFRAQQ